MGMWVCRVHAWVGWPSTYPAGNAFSVEAVEEAQDRSVAKSRQESGAE